MAQSIAFLQGQFCTRHGFTLIEQIMVIILLSILSVVAYSKWPVGMEEDAAAKEFRRAVRYAQHKAMTRQWNTADDAWGIEVAGNNYTIKRRGADCSGADKDNLDRCAEEDYRNRTPNSRKDLDTNKPSSINNEVSISDGKVWFNGLGEPLDDSGSPIVGQVVFTLGTAPNSRTVSIFPETGYVE